MARKKGKAKVVPIDDYTPSSKQEFDLKIQLENSIDALPEKMRVCFLLYAVEQFKLREIAQILDISTGGVKSNIYHAKMKLRGMLNPTYAEEQ
jgi:RNA polymerase sigma-70 factor (ECF subfamily)